VDGGILVQPPGAKSRQETRHDFPRSCSRGSLPNPFAGETAIRFTLEHAENADLSVFDLSGRLVKHIARGWLEAGPHSLPWDGTDERGNRAAPGVYLYRLRAGAMAGTKHMVILR
jgi:hypothetical protein